MSDSDPERISVSVREFQNYRDDVKEKFDKVSKCTVRIEEKISELVEKINPILDDYQKKKAQEKKNSKMSLLIFGSAVGGGFSVLTAVLLYMLGLGK